MAHIQPVIFGEVLFDCFPDGTQVLGGAPFNVAWHLQGFGLLPVLISRIGNDQEGLKIMQAMTDWKMVTRGLQLDQKRSTGTVKVSLENGDPTFSISTEDAYGHIEGVFSSVPDEVPLLYHGTLALWHPEAQKVCKELKHHCHAPVFIDVNLRNPWWERKQVLSTIEGASWLKLNEEELGLLYLKHYSAEEKAKALIEDFHLKVLILTKGSRGATIFLKEGDKVEITPEPQNIVVDTVGAGDAFSAVFILGILSDWSMDKTIRHAQEFASFVVGQRGAITADPTFYTEFVEKWSSGE